MGKFFLIMISCMALFLILTEKYTNPYKLIMIFGKKGSGKSTFLTKTALQHIKKGWTVYSTEYIPGTYHIEPEYIGFVQLVDFNYKPFNPDDYKGIVKILKIIRNWIKPYRPKILLLCDEVGMIWDNRNFKNFKPEVRDYFKLERHHYVKCILFSQTFDVDKKLRDLTDSMYLVGNVGRIWSYGKKIRKFITIKESATDDSSTIAEGLKFEPFIFFFLGSRTLTFIPAWSKYFNSFQVEPLPAMKFEKTEFRKTKNIKSNSLDDIELEDVEE